MQPRTVILLGPQGTQPNIGTVLGELGIRKKVALVHAGYQERESEDGALISTFGVPAVNLRLHRRGVEVFREDKEFTEAYQARQQRLRHMQSFYRVRLEKTEDAAKTISLRYVEPELLSQEEKVSVDQFRSLDSEHLERCAAVHTTFDKKWQPTTRPAVAKHVNELRDQLATAEALVISGGHVASLYNRLALFDVLGLLGDKPVIAWSAGAMVLTDRIVIFHDYPPYGSDIAQVLDAGFGIAQDVVVLPDPARRVNYDARAGIQRFARRMAPATAVAMGVGTKLVFDRGRLVLAQATRLATNGDIEHDWDGTPTRFSTPHRFGVHV
jgi:hypothetical protein